jgi:hypothetical protein
MWRKRCQSGFVGSPPARPTASSATGLAILERRQPRDLTAKLLAHSRLPLAWHEQRTVLGFA